MQTRDLIKPRPLDLNEVNQRLAEKMAEFDNHAITAQELKAYVAGADAIGRNVAIMLKNHDMVGEVPVIPFLPKTSGIPIVKIPKYVKHLRPQIENK